jgi:site-specific recombinase XerD
MRSTPRPTATAALKLVPGQTVSAPDLPDLLASWEIELRNISRSPRTIASYLTSVRLYLDWLDANGHPPVLDKALARAWTAEMQDNGAEPATARVRQQALRQFAKFVVEEGELPDDPLLGLNPPALVTKVIDGLTADEIDRLLKVCRGTEFIDRRDEAALRLLLETGLRAGELVALTVEDVDPRRGMLVVRRGKGGKGRVVPFGPQTARALDRYLRARKSHRLTHTPALWLGGGGQTFGYHGLVSALKGRAELAGIKGFHVHRTRHTFASRWLAANGSEGGLMAVAGWSSRDMIDRYTAATASERAADEARSLNLGNL